MAGFGYRHGFGGNWRRRGVGASAHMRVQPIDAFNSFSIAPHTSLGAIAMALVYGNGADPIDQNPAASIGAPFGGWRMSGISVVPTVASNPVTQASEVIYIGVGSQDVAINVMLDGNVTSYGGGYHGGKNNSIQYGSDPTVGGMVSGFWIREDYQIPWSGGRTANVTSIIEHKPDGSIVNTNRVVAPFDTLTAALALLMLDTTFTTYSINQGADWISCAAAGKYLEGLQHTEVWWRKPLTGTIVKAVLDVSGASNFKESYFDVDANRVKFRARFDTVEVPGVPNSDHFGDQTCVATYRLDRSEPDPLPSWLPYVMTFDQATPGNPNLPLGVTRTGAGTAPATLDTGTGEFTIGGGSGVNRWIITDPDKLLPPGSYVVKFIYRTSNAAGTGQSQVSGDSSGSVATDPLSAAQSFNSQAGATHTHTFVVPEGKLGYIAWQATTNVDGRTVTLVEIQVTGVPDQ